MKKTFLFALAATLMLGMASCSKENVEPTTNQNTDVLANAIKANESNNFANTQWVSNVDTVLDLAAIYGINDPNIDLQLPINTTFTLDFNATGDTLALSISAFDSSEVVFVTADGESMTINFAFNYDQTTNVGTMVGTVNEIMNGDPVTITLNFVYDVTNNTMTVTSPLQGDPNDPVSTTFLGFFETLVFSIV